MKQYLIAAAIVISVNMLFLLLTSAAKKLRRQSAYKVKAEVPDEDTMKRDLLNSKKQYYGDVKEFSCHCCPAAAFCSGMRDDNEESKCKSKTDV